MAFGLLGFAVLHAITQGMNGRAYLLGSVYAAVLLLEWPLLVLCLLGLIEIVFNVRERIARRRQSPTIPHHPHSDSSDQGETTMEVILLERIGKLGQMGEVVRVKDGYARNFLLPRGKALRATADNKSRFEGMKAELQTKSLEAKGVAGQIAAKVDGKSYIVIRQASESGQLFGSVSPRDIAAPASRPTAPRSTARTWCSMRRSRPSASTRCRSICTRTSKSRSP